MFVRNYHYYLRNNLEERSSHLLRSGSLNSNMKLFQVHVCICHTRDCLHLLRAIVRHWKLMHDVFCSSRMLSLPNNHMLQHMASISIGPYECFYTCSLFFSLAPSSHHGWLGYFGEMLAITCQSCQHYVTVSNADTFPS